MVSMPLPGQWMPFTKTFGNGSVQEQLQEQGFSIEIKAHFILAGPVPGKPGRFEATAYAEASAGGASGMEMSLTVLDTAFSPFESPGDNIRYRVTTSIAMKHAPTTGWVDSELTVKAWRGNESAIISQLIQYNYLTGEKRTIRIPQGNEA